MMAAKMHGMQGAVAMYSLKPLKQYFTDNLNSAPYTQDKQYVEQPRVKQQCDTEEWEVPETQRVQTGHRKRAASMRCIYEPKTTHGTKGLYRV